MRASWAHATAAAPRRSAQGQASVGAGAVSRETRGGARPCLGSEKGHEAWGVSDTGHRAL